MTRPLLKVPIGFSPAVIEKVERLLEVLTALQGDPELGEEFVLHGGTALNVFHDTVPRLSIDIDLLFVGEADVDAMRKRRPEIDVRLREVVGALGYTVQATNHEHSGQTYRIKYPDDYVKIDISYLARVTLLEPEQRTCGLSDPPTTFPVLRIEELIAGKVKAMMERLAARDLYDLHRLSVSHPTAFGDALTRAITVRGICLADTFPSVTNPIEALSRFANQPPEFKVPLADMLSVDEILNYEGMLAGVGAWLAPLSSLSEKEGEFMRCLAEQAEQRPELLFSAWPAVHDRASVDPVMAWKVLNLRKRLGLEEA